MARAQPPPSDGPSKESERPQLTQLTRERVEEESGGREKEEMMDELELLDYFHGQLLEEEVGDYVSTQGEFILRTRPDDDGGITVVISVKWKGDVVHFPMQFKEGPEYSFDNKTKSSNPLELIKLHIRGVAIEREGKEAISLVKSAPRKNWELKAEMVQLEKKLGEGAFGEVHAGILKMKKTMKKGKKVAIKVIKRSSNTEQATLSLQKEAVLMRQYSHRNIVQFHGIVQDRSTTMVVMELVDGGGLDYYLKRNKSVTVRERGAFAHDIACGLTYLHALGCIHRDIACRNCLLDRVKKCAKISDFGMSRQADECKLTEDEKIPIRWTAPEVVRTRVYTKAADIYAYGILVWEIFSNAAIPFGDLNNVQIKEGIMREDFRPVFPKGTPADIEKAASDCWRGDVTKRPTLSSVATRLQGYNQKESESSGSGKGEKSKGGKKGNSRDSRKSKGDSHKDSPRSKSTKVKAKNPSAKAKKKK